MEYKALILDIDGTLVNSKKQITPKTKQAVRSLQERGICVAIASGRPVPGLKDISDELEMKKYGGCLLAINGGKIIDCKTDEVLSEQHFSAEYIPTLYRLATEHGVNIMSYENDTVISEILDDEYLQLEARINHLPLKQVKSFVDYVTFPVPKAIITGDGDKLAELEPIVKNAVGDKLNVFRSEPFFLEIMPPDIDKAYGLSELAKITGISTEEMVACGDGYNDITMIQHAGLGVAMANAREETKKAADFITLSNEEDGVAYVIEKFF